MKRFLSYLVSLTVLTTLYIPVLAQKPKNFTVVIDDLTTRLGNAHTTAQPLRLAIVPFGTHSRRHLTVWGLHHRVNYRKA